MIALGYGLASYMGMAFYYAHDPVAKWRGPLGIALLFPIIMLVMLPFIPESPRFLLMKGRIDEARDIVLRLHAIPGDPDNEFARGEFYQMSKQAELDRATKVTWVSKSPSIFHVNRTLTFLPVGDVLKGVVPQAYCIGNGLRLRGTINCRACH